MYENKIWIRDPERDRERERKKEWIIEKKAKNKKSKIRLMQKKTRYILFVNT